jgi:OOP family OmpA-OmpF porin
VTRLVGEYQHCLKDKELLKRLYILSATSLLGLLLSLSLALAQDLESAETARDRARSAGAESLAPKQYQAAEKSLTRAVSLMQQGRDGGQVTAAFRGATDAFDSAELAAITADVLADARAAIKGADAQRAKRYAPVTLAAAREQLATAEAMLKDDRSEITRAAAIAADAATTARHAGQIADVVREKPKLEDLILEWESYLLRIQIAAGATMSADTPPEEITTYLEEELERIRSGDLQLRNDLADSQAFAAALEEEIRELDLQLGGASAERRELMLQLEDQARTEEQFAQTETIFLPSEATVFRQSNNVVIRLFGLEFASGASKLDGRNKALLEKINRAIEVFPDSTLIVEGHTDSQGGARLNQRLSQNRAEAVQNYLIETFRITPARITAAGFGASRPIGVNETEEGRAKNRRIDLIITPAQNSP